MSPERSSRGPRPWWWGSVAVATGHGAVCTVVHLLALLAWWAAHGVADTGARYGVGATPELVRWLWVGAAGSVVALVGSLALTAWGVVGLRRGGRPGRGALRVSAVAGAIGTATGLTVLLATLPGDDGAGLAVVVAGWLALFSVVLLLWTGLVWAWRPSLPIREDGGRMGSHPTP